MERFSAEHELPTISGIRPNFYLIPYDMEAMENQIVRFELRVSGRPEPEIIWFKDGEQIFDCEHFKIVVNEEGSHALLIMGADVQDSGTYKCIAQNRNGEASFTVKLIVFEKEPTISPKFVERFHNTTIKAGESVVFHCRAVGTPSPKLTWQKDGMQIDSNLPSIEVKTDDSSSSLLLNNVTSRDAGWYQCTAQNPSGSVTTRARLNVESIHQIPQGEPVKIIIPKTHRKIEQEPEKFETVHLKHVQRYYEEIDADRSNFITYEEQKTKPIFATHLRDLSLRKGNTAHFEAYLKASNYGDLKIQWFLNEKLIEDSQRFIITDKYGYIALTIMNVNPEDSGIITCKVSNQYGEAITSATLKCADVQEKSTVKPVASKTASTTKTMSDKQSEKQSIEVKAEEKEDDEEYRQKYDMVEDSELFKYKKAVEETYSKIAPHFVQPLQSNIFGNPGENILLEAQITPVNDPNMRIEWYFNGQPLMSNERISSKFNFGYISLVISNLNEKDSGVYMVKAINAVNEATSTSSIKVNPIEKKHVQTMEEETIQTTKIRKHTKEEQITRPAPVPKAEPKKPYFKKHFPNILESAPNSTVRFEAFVEPNDDPNLEVYLLKNNETLTPSSKINILYNRGLVSIGIKDVNNDDIGLYKCIAKNPSGSAETTGELKMKPIDGMFGSKMYGQQETVDRFAKTTTTTRTMEQVSMKQPKVGMAPIFRIPLQIPPLMYSEGETVYMEAFVEPVNDPNLVLEWFHNNMPLNFTPRHQSKFDFGCISLAIYSVNVDDGGEYTVLARNQYGQAYSSSNVTIVRIPGQEYQTIPTVPKLVESQMLESQRITKEEWFDTNDLNGYPKTDISDRNIIIDEPQETFHKPKFLTKFNNVNVLENRTACLESRIEPALDPNLTIDWFFEGRPLTVGNRFQPYYHFGYVVLKILKTQPSDSGTYTCRISNQKGFEEMSAIINCQEENIESELQFYEPIRPKHKEPIEVINNQQAPNITRTLKDVQAIEGEKIHFECFVQPSDDPDLVVQWFKNGEPLQKGSRFIEICDFGYVCLDILYVYPEDSGVYTVKATNKFGEASTTCNLHCIPTANLDTRTLNEISFENIRKLESRKEVRHEKEMPIQDAPKFLQPIQSANRIENERVTFETRLIPVGDENLTVEWYLNGRPLKSSSRISFIFDFGYVSLAIKELTPYDSGTYTCRAVNANGEATVSATLNVQPTKTIIDDVFYPGTMEKFSALETKTFKRKEFEDDMAGQTKPYFVHQLKGTNQLEEGMSAHFQCVIEPSRDETMTVEWFHNGRPLPVGSRYKTLFDFGYITLDIYNVTDEDSGEYKVKVSNHLGTVESSINLNVLGKENILRASNQPSSLDKIQVLERSHKKKKIEEDYVFIDKPKFGAKLNDHAINEGEPVYLESSLMPINDPSMKVEWYFNDQLLKVGHRFKTLHDFGYVSLQILYAYPEDSGTYECRATNDLGEDRISCNINVQGKKIIDTSTIHDESLHQIRQIERTTTVKRTDEIINIVQPKIVKPLQNSYELNEGDSVCLECAIHPANDPSMNVQWLLNGTPIKTGHRFVVINEFGYIALRILYVYPEDSGTYSVR